MYPVQLTVHDESEGERNGPQAAAPVVTHGLPERHGLLFADELHALREQDRVGVRQLDLGAGKPDSFLCHVVGGG